MKENKPTPLSLLNALFSSLGTDPRENIHLIVSATADILNAPCAVFNRLDRVERSLVAWSSANAPKDFPKSDTPEGHICYEGVIRGGDSVLAISDILQTPFAESDPNVARYGLRSYLGFPVCIKGEHIGALCVVDMVPRTFTPDEIDLISTLAKAITLEEERLGLQADFTRSQEMVNQMQKLSNVAGWELGPHSLKGYWTSQAFRIYDMPLDSQSPDADMFMSMCATDSDRRRVRAALGRAFRKDGSQIVEFRIVTARGNMKWVKVTTQNTVNSEGRKKLVGSMQDITEQKKTEEVLRQARKAAEAANMAKSKFLANMSHEVRTPLNGVLGMLQLAIRTDLNAEQREYIEIALQSCRGLLTIINDLLDLSRIEAGKIRLVQEPIDLTEIVNSVLHGFRHQLEDSNIRLTYSLDNRLPRFLVGDSGRLRQILYNLIGNAVKFTANGTIRLDAIPIARHNNTARILFTVSDTGIGIPDTALSRIFEPFEQADTARENMRGTGLGLGIVRSLVETMGGTISVESEQSKGTTIYLSIPFNLTQGSSMHTGQDSKGARKQGLRILMVEDNVMNLTAPRLFLEKSGHTVDSAENGAEALTILEKSRFDLILMDVEMPELDGVETTRRIRESTDLKTPASVPIIALTAFAFASDRKRCFDAGMDAFLSKPVDFKELEQVVKSVGRTPTTPPKK